MYVCVCVLECMCVPECASFLHIHCVVCVLSRSGLSQMRVLDSDDPNGMDSGDLAVDHSDLIDYHTRQ
jgi:hypothetical protein